MGEKLELSGYMGRVIITGLTTHGDPADIYFAQGRSPPSKRRKLVPYPHELRVGMELNSETSLEEMRRGGGNPELLLYDAFCGTLAGQLIVSNGFQTNYDAVWEGEGRGKESLVGRTPGGIYSRFVKSSMAAREAILESLKQAGSEVDGLRTARIASARDCATDPQYVNFGIVVRPRDQSGAMLNFDKTRVEWMRLNEGDFVMLATYGVHSPPYDGGMPPEIESVSDCTRRIRLEGTDVGQLVEEVWEALPKEIMVGVAAAEWDSNRGFSFAAKNMKE